MESLLLLFAIVLLAIFIAWPFIWLRRRQIRLFASKWAEENGFRLIGYKEKLFSPFTFSLRTSRSQEVVLVEVIDAHGNKKKCWLILGGYFSGLFSYQVECKWVE